MRAVGIIAGLLLVAGISRGQNIVSDNYNTAGNGTGFNLNAGINSGINPPTTRLAGTAAASLRYLPTGTKTNAAFSISGNKILVTSAANPGRFVLSSDGVTPFNFSSALGSTGASPAHPVVYDVSIAIANNSTGTLRCSFALATAEGDATTWDFGFQLYRTAATDTYYTIGKRIDIAASGLAADLNSYITNTAPGTYGSEVTILMRVTDAGAETTNYSSRIRLSMDGGFSWFYDSANDPDLANGWHFDGPGRYFMWDIAPDAGPVTYDNFSVSPVPVSAASVAPADNTQNIGAAPTLSVLVSNTVPGNVTVTFYGHDAGKPYPGRDFLIPVLPDTQNYARQDSAVGQAVKEMWYSQTDWIVAHGISDNIPFVIQLGDIVQNGDILNSNPNDTEWQIATNAMYRLENPTKTLRQFGIPYGCAVGNHDQEPNGDEDGSTTHYNQYFGTSHFAPMPYYGGHFSTNNDSYFDLFSVDGLDFIIFYFEFHRYGSGVLDWASSVIATNQNRRMIVATHYAGSDVTPSNFSPEGQAFYDRFKTNANFFLMLGGHVFGNDGEGSRTDTLNGHTVHTLISDYQGRTNGGNGMMRLMYFSPSNNVVSVKTYSSWTDQYETDSDSQFTFNYNMQLPSGPGAPATAYVALGTNFNVAPGTQSSVVWPSLQANKTYEWYAKVTDAAGNTFISPPRRFVTTTDSAPIVTNQTVTVVGDQAVRITLQAFDPDGDALTFRTNSRPVRGLNSDFDATKGLITYLPAHGYRGLDRFTFLVNDSVTNSAVANVDLIVTAPADANTNGLPDAWETAFGVTDPNADPDGDGLSNIAEYFANTNPTNAASALKVLSAQGQANGQFTLSWASVGGTRYRIQYSDSIAGPFTDVIRPIDSEMDPAPNGTPSTQTFIDTVTGTTNMTRYYRIKVVQ